MTQKKTVKSPIKMVKKEESKPEKKKFDPKKLASIYEFETKLPGSRETIRFRPLTTGQLKRLLSFEGEEDPRVITFTLNDLMREVIVFKDGGYPVENMFIKDRPYLLLQMRNKTKGDKWKTAYECQECKSQNLLNVDFKNLKIKTLEPEKVNYNITIFENLSLDLRFMKVQDEIDVYDFLGDVNYKDKRTQAEMIILMYANTIENIYTSDGTYNDLSLADKKYFIEEMPTNVYEGIVNWHEENDYGADFTIKHKCISCNQETEINTSPDNFFF